MSIYYLQDSYQFLSHIVVLAESLEQARALYFAEAYPNSAPDAHQLESVILITETAIDAPSVIMWTHT